MAVKRASSQAADVPEVQAAAAMMLEREETRKQQARKRAKRRRRALRRAERRAVQKMHQSIEVIKWCIVAICTVWLISFIISIAVLIRVQSKLAEIEKQVQGIQKVMENPFASAGSRLGGQVDDKLREFFRLPNPQSNDK